MTTEDDGILASLEDTDKLQIVTVIRECGPYDGQPFVRIEHSGLSIDTIGAILDQAHHAWLSAMCGQLERIDDEEDE